MTGAGSCQVLVDEAADHGFRQVGLTGSELFPHPDIPELLDPPPAVAPEISPLRRGPLNLLSPA